MPLFCLFLSLVADLKRKYVAGIGRIDGRQKKPGRLSVSEI
jgi:hypothetical protein